MSAARYLWWPSGRRHIEQHGGEARTVPVTIPEQCLVVELALEVQLHVTLPRETDPAMELHRATRPKARSIRCRSLGHMSGAQCPLGLVVDSTGRVVEVGAREVDAYHHIDQRMLDGLEKTDRTIELLPHPGVLGGSLEQPLSRAAEIRGN